MHAALFSYIGKYGAPRHRVGGRLDGPCRDLPSRSILYPNIGSFEGRGAVVGRDVPRRARGGC
jgi:hypothetical protein